MIHRTLVWKRHTPDLMKWKTKNKQTKKPQKCRWRDFRWVQTAERRDVLNREGSFGAEDIPAPWHDPAQPQRWLVIVILHLLDNLLLGRVCPDLWVSPLPVSVCFSAREVLWRRSCSIQVSPSLRLFLPLQLCMLAPVVASCLPNEWRGLHFPGHLDQFHSCIIICYPWSKHMPGCKDSINVES